MSYDLGMSFTQQHRKRHLPTTAFHVARISRQCAATQQLALAAEFLTLRKVDRTFWTTSRPSFAGGAEDEHRIFWFTLLGSEPTKARLSRAVRAVHAAARRLPDQCPATEHCPNGRQFVAVSKHPMITLLSNVQED